MNGESSLIAPVESVCNRRERKRYIEKADDWFLGNLNSMLSLKGPGYRWEAIISMSLRTNSVVISHAKRGSCVRAAIPNGIFCFADESTDRNFLAACPRGVRSICGASEWMK